MKSKKKLSISTKLAFRFTFILSAVVILLTLIFHRVQLADLNYQRSQELNLSTSITSKAYKNYINKNHNHDSFSMGRVPKHLTYTVYDISSGKNKIIATNAEEILFLPLTSEKAKIYTQKSFGDTKDLKIIYVAYPIDEYPSIIVQTWIDLQNDSLYTIRHNMPRMILAMLIPILVICYFIAWLIAKRIMKPVVKMTEAAKHISSSNLDSLIPLKNNGDEIDQLAMTFNDLFKRLKIDFDRERQFTSDVSHELKTPVAVILGQANLLRRWGKDDPAQLDKSIGTIISETKSMEAIIQNLLQMTRIESGRILPSKEEFLLSELTSKIQQELPALDNSAEINFDFDDSLKIITDFELLHQVLMIVISNSLKFCPKPLVLNFKAASQKDSITISISDNGPGFKESTLPHVFERFYRGDDAHTRSAGGSGLGLSIAQTIVESLGGTITASNDEMTKGAKLTVSLP
ncbi:HAMP domain-containing sensor histidine kinase [Treponema sp.]|uniref:sensor histidine kinase n=1 Tax=Treponema sp. TaxID=166 RepID=UPI00298DED0C|nr:HAMP domain-containing sensor histidine kinase [Treponema sp.]